LLLAGAVILSDIAGRLGVPYPAFLALGGAAIALVPDAPRFTLDPHLALALFVAPVLLDAAYDTSLRDLKENWLTVGSLAVVAVVITTVAVAIVARLLVPDMPWGAALALGAIVAPPDAAAATAVLRQVTVPHRLLVILEGESLLNDASALLIYRAAVGGVVAGSFGGLRELPALLLVVAGSVVVGWVFARMYLRLMSRVFEIPARIALQVVGTFGVWLLAERVGLSGILTVVVYGITIAGRAPDETPAKLRVPSYAVWDTAVFVLNVLAFLLIGLQLGPIWARLSVTQRVDYAAVAGAVLGTVVVARFAWVMIYTTMVRVKIQRYGPSQSRSILPPTVRGALLVSWCGMRGIVTLAAALALPVGHDGHAFPYRDLIIFCAFSVVFGTLVLQGFTLRPLLALLDLHDDGSVEREVNHARITALKAALDILRNETSPEADAIRREYQDALRRTAATPDVRVPMRLIGDRLRRRAVAASRKAVSDLRFAGEIGDDAFHRMEERLDRLELSAGEDDQV
ncbi:MAG: Na+/H+ antiporter, partial [Candidatus Binatus sp.]|nr:Na+/H+ antiporter [Candidatus Binatus sp.]